MFVWSRNRSSIAKSSRLLLFAIADLNHNVAEILEILKEEDDGEETEETR